MEEQETVPALLRRLVVQLSGATEDERIQSLLNYAVRILTSRLTPPPIATDEHHIAQLLKKKISKERGPADALRFAELCEQLDARPSLSSTWPILYLLFSLSRIGEQSVGSSFQTRSLEYISPVQLDSLPDDQGSKRATRSNEDKDRRQSWNSLLPSSGPGNQLSEQSVLCRDCLYAFQGLLPSHVAFDHATQSYTIPAEQGKLSSPSTTQLLSRVCEIGWHCRNILGLVNKVKGKDPPPGLVMQGFIAAVQAELADYYRLIAVLEGQLHMYNKSLSEHQQKHLGSSALTLRRLLVWVQGPVDRLRTLGLLVEGALSSSVDVQPLHGGKVASHVYSYLQHGNPQRRELISGILRQTSAPIAEAIKEWISRGHLRDPWGEFFIEERTGIHSHQLWTRKYRLRHEMIPSFISNSLAQKILHIGKSINFLRSCTGDGDLDLPLVADQLGFTFSFGEVELEETISRIAEGINERVLSLLFDKYRFLSHCEAIHRYLLLEQGDFILHLMRLLGSDLDAPAHTIHRHNLTGAVERAITSSNAQYDDPDILRRLDIRLLSVGGDGEGSGWDIFALGYAVDLPVNTIFTPKAMEKYLRIFNFLWLVRRAQQSLSGSWKRRATSRRQMKGQDTMDRNIDHAFHRADILRSRMLHFLSNLQHYISFEVITPAWKIFMQELENASSLDEVLRAHKSFLREVKDKSFVHGKKGPTSSMSTIVRKLFAQTLRFRSIQDNLQALLQDIAELESAEHTIAQLAGMEKEYDDTFKLLRGMLLSRHGSSNHHPLFFLAFRLDFNGHYQRQADREKEAQMEQRTKEKEIT